MIHQIRKTAPIKHDRVSAVTASRACPSPGAVYNNGLPYSTQARAKQKALQHA